MKALIMFPIVSIMWMGVLLALGLLKWLSARDLKAAQHVHLHGGQQGPYPYRAT